MSERKLSEVAVHEAAHVLAAIEHGIRVIRVSIGQREVVLEPPGDCLEQGQHHGAVAAGYAIVALAGQAAAPSTGLSKSDRLLLERALFLGSWSDPADELVRAFSALAERFADDHREEIEKLAIDLNHCGSMTGAEIEKIVSRGNDRRQ